jgi:hypothetical protein
MTKTAHNQQADPDTQGIAERIETIRQAVTD